MDDETVDQNEKNYQGSNKGAHDDEDKPYPSNKIDNSGHNSNLGIKTEHKRQLPVSSESDMLNTDVNAVSPPSYKTRGSPCGARYGILELLCTLDNTLFSSCFCDSMCVNFLDERSLHVLFLLLVDPCAMWEPVLYPVLYLNTMISFAACCNIAELFGGRDWTHNY